jgi:predicted phage baseplate assembly protein
VNDVRWQEVPTLFGRGPRERVYVTRLADDGMVTVQFGDGKSGARLPTGTENVRAIYRKGTGRDGVVKAGQLSLLMTRPLGVKEVANLQPSTGGQDPETLDRARENAPLTVLTFDRLVSLRDYEDFSRAFSGVAKALATWTWNVHSRGVLVTVAGPDGAAIVEGGVTHGHLLEALVGYGNPLLPVAVKSFRPMTFRLSGTVRVAGDRVPEKVGGAVRDALCRRFGFAAREFGQPVAMSDVMAVIQEIPGVVFVDIDRLHRSDRPARWNGVVAAERPSDGASADAVLPAELLVLDTDSLIDLEVKPA